VIDSYNSLGMVPIVDTVHFGT